MKKVTQQAQELLLKVKNKHTAVDFTCGNGNDTFFLAHYFDEVYAFDIQETAVNNTKKVCEHLDNVHVHLKSHLDFHRVMDTFDAGIFNLGYLPHGDETITTDETTVINTLEKCWKYLRDGGMIVLVLYPGFEQGKTEANAVENYCIDLSSKQFDVLKVQLINRHHAPYIICIEKKG